MAKPLVYSYVRFSTPEQRKGTGKARQDALAGRWCVKRGYTLCRNYSDLGVSAYKGRNASHGDLSRFLELVQTGKIPRGSVLLVESLDRLSRDNINRAVELFLSIINSGVKVVTMCDDMEYSDGRCDMAQLMMSLLIFARANDESRMKSQRKAASWQLKREAAQKEGKPLGGKLPAWIKVKNGKYLVIPEKAERVKAIFRDYVGGKGIYLLNKRHRVPKATILYWLSNPVVIGTLRVTEDGGQIDLPGHYPAIIDRQTWRKSQALRSERYIARRAGKTGWVNLFAGLLVDKKVQRFDVSRHYGFSSYISPNGYCLQAAPLESVVCSKLRAHLFRKHYVENETPHPEEARIAKRIAAVQNQLVNGRDLVQTLVPVLRDLQKRQREFEQGRRRVVTEQIDESLVVAMWGDASDKDARLQVREILRENVQQIQIQKVISNSGWYMLVAGGITKLDGTEISFAYAYCTRSDHFVECDWNDELDEHLKLQLNQLPRRKKSDAKK